MGWLGWNMQQVRERNRTLAFIGRLPLQPEKPKCWWVERKYPDKVPIIWRLLGAKAPFESVLRYNENWTDADLQRARALLPDYRITIAD
jgi:hypothetical protein